MLISNCSPHITMLYPIQIRGSGAISVKDFLDIADPKTKPLTSGVLQAQMQVSRMLDFHWSAKLIIGKNS